MNNPGEIQEVTAHITGRGRIDLHCPNCNHDCGTAFLEPGEELYVTARRLHEEEIGRRCPGCGLAVYGRVQAEGPPVPEAVEGGG